MKVRLYAKQELKLEGLIELNDEKSHYLQKVLRLKTGDEVFVFNQTEGEFLAKFINDKKRSTLKIFKFIKKPEAERKPKLNLVFANLKNNVTSDLLNSCTQVGVDEFFPIVTKFTNNIHFSVARAEKIIEEACEQSGRIKLPEVNEIQNFDSILKKIKSESHILFCDEKASFESQNFQNLTSEVFLFIGPEGGFSKEEREKLQSFGNCKTISLGDFILRAETAAVCVSFLFNFINR